MRKMAIAVVSAVSALAAVSPVAGASPDVKILKKGDEGSGVACVQAALRASGVFPLRQPGLKVNGVFDDATESAVFQYKLSVGGPWQKPVPIVDQSTGQSLYSVLPEGSEGLTKRECYPVMPTL